MINAAEEIRNTILSELPRLHDFARRAMYPTGQAPRDPVAWMPYVHEPSGVIWKLQIDRFDGRLFEIVVQYMVAAAEADDKPCVITISFALPPEIRSVK